MEHAAKVALLTAGADLARARGLEIGPRNSPLIHKSAGPVLYADYADTQTVRANLHGTDIDPASVLDIDIVTGGGKLAPLMPHRADYAVASHVAEHVPDLLGWLADLHGVLAPDGTLGLAIPDRRFTFDRFRAESTIAEAVEAYLHEYTRPSLRQVFDSAWQAIDIPVDQAWRNGIADNAAEQRLARLKPAFDLVRRLAGNGAYNDAHCWVFTPASFLDLLEQAAQLDLLPYTLHIFHPTELHGYEFFAVLRRAEGDHAAATRASINQAKAIVQDWPAEAAFLRAHPTPDILRLERENAALTLALDTMRNSRFWRVTAPARASVSRIKGLLS
jgi:SAM-dependent methyltransferase